MVLCKETDRTVQLALPYVYCKINEMTTYQMLLHYYRYKSTLVYNITVSGYHNVNTSLDILIELLSFQCMYTVDTLVRFLSTLYNVCEKTNGKRNTVFIKGPPSCGKSYFTYSLANFYVNYGNVESPQKHSNFPFMDCSRKRILIWDEALSLIHI